MPNTIAVPLISLEDFVCVPISEEEEWILERGSELSKSTVLSLICGRARERYLKQVQTKLDSDLRRYQIIELLKKQES